MQKIRFDEAVKLVREKDERYPPDAYQFLREVLDYTVKALRSDELIEHRHVSGPELLQGMVEYALKEYGSMAIAVLDSWGIRRGEDLGNMVFNLIEIGAFGKSDEDSPADFSGAINLKEELKKPFRPTRKVLLEPHAQTPGSTDDLPSRGTKPVTPTEA